MRRFVIAAATAGLFVVSHAHAADMRMPVKASPVMVAAAQDWSQWRGDNRDG